MEITIKDIANRVGVAPSTVSRALNNKGGVSEKTRGVILDIAKELGYVPNVAARGLAMKRTENLGFLINRRQSLDPGTFYGEIMEGIEAVARDRGYHLIFSTNGSETLPTVIQEKRVDGLILAGCDIKKNLILSLKRKGIPLVLVDNHLDKVDSVATDNVNGAYEAVERLISLGHQRIGFIAERFNDLSFSERFEGYKLALEDHDLRYDEDLVAEGVMGPDCGYVAMRRLLEKGVPTAVFAANDEAAAGAIRAIKGAGFRVPDEMAVVSFDDGLIALHTEPLLTTMRVFRKRMGMVAAGRLIELIADPDQPSAQIKLSTQLIVRGSCGSPEEERERR